MNSTQRRTGAPGAAALAGALVLAGALAAWFFLGRETPAPAPLATGPARPAAPIPVIVYLIDTLRADRLGLYGYGKPTSPRMDALAKESVVFDHAYGPAPWTLPAVSSIMTSRYPCETGVTRAGMQLSPALPTLAEHLKSVGLATAEFYQNDFAGQSGLKRGFDRSEFRHDLETLDLDTADWLKQVGSQPFFLYLHSMEPHAAYFAPPKFIQRFGFVNVDDREAYKAHWIMYKKIWYLDSQHNRPPGTTDTTAGVQLAIANLDKIRDQALMLYDAAVAFADDELGQTIDVLKQAGIWDKAIFIVLADHGEELEDHGLWFHTQSVYEELTHVPLIVHFPGGAGGGTRIAERVSTLDLAPTILDYLGHGDLCTGCRGQSLLPLVGFGGSYQSVAVPSIRLDDGGYYRPIKISRGDTNVVVRDNALKAIWNKDVNRTEVYDLAADPGEHHDLVDADPGRTRAMTEAAKGWYAQCQASLVPGGRKEELGEEARRRLEAHGYFQ